jgi:hypothetical protein
MLRQVHPVLDTRQGQISIQDCKLTAVGQWLPSGVTQTPLDFKFYCMALPMVGCDLLHKPLGII